MAKKKHSPQTRRQHQRFENKYYEGLGTPILVLKASDTRPTFANSACKQLLGVTDLQHLTSRPFQHYFAKEDQAKALAFCKRLVRSQLGHSKSMNHVRIISGNKEELHVHIVGKLINLNRRRCLVLSFEDITQVQRLEEEQEKARREVAHISKLADIGRLAAGVAHELNNPLMIIQGFAENIELLLEEGTIDDQELKLQLAPILKSSDRMSRIISQMTRMARDDDIQLVRVDVYEVIKDVLSLLTQQLNRIEIDLDTDELEHHLVRCDPNQLEQILLNIISNATHALENIQNQRKIRISSQRNNANIVIKIWNSGPAIPSEIQDKIMSPFFTTKEVGKGTGLGLALSYGIMKAHDGELSFQSTDKGTEFRLTFPVLTEGERLEPGVHRKVLVVDDDPHALQVLKNKLERFGYEVTPAKNAKEALRKYASETEIKAVFTDLKMPEVDGFQLIKQIREKNPHLLIYALSGYAHPRAIEMEAYRLGINGFLKKPIDHNIFSRVIFKMEEHLKKQEPATEPRAS